MPLKTVVKVGNITNLSDARYCSGMGVDMLGFRVVEGQTDYIAPKLFQEIRGWITGPKIVAEIYGLTSHEQLARIIENYAPDYLEMSADEFRNFHDALSLPCIVAGTIAGNEKVLYCLVAENSLNAAAGSPALVKVTSDKQLLTLIEAPGVAGVALNGSGEERPGFKDYSSLADILEKLDEY